MQVCKMKVREGGEGAVPAAGAEILLQPIETASLEEIPCSCGVPCCSTGCFLKALQFTDSPHQIRLIPKDCSQWKDPPWNREQGVVNTNCYGLTLTPHSPSSLHYLERERRRHWSWEQRSEAECGKREGQGGKGGISHFVFVSFCPNYFN